MFLTLKVNIFKTICVGLLCVYCGSCYEQKDEGSYCSHLGIRGICRKITDCSVAIHSLKRGKPHNLLRCGFEGITEVVCCPEISDRSPTIETTTLDNRVVWSGEHEENTKNNGQTTNGNPGRWSNKRKCETMCEKFYKDNNIKPEIDFHVLNGEDASLGQFPHVAALGFYNEDYTIDWQRCAASLIDPKYLLTAAHCVVCNGCTDPVKVRLGVVNITDDRAAQDIDVKNVIVANNYNVTTKHNDIAIIELRQEVRMTRNIYPACLYTEGNDPLGLQVTGWGQTVHGDSSSRSETLQYAIIEPVATDQCNTTILTKNTFTLKTIIDTQICAISKSDACAGDSGGPLQILSKKGGFDIVGIVSYGIQCGTTVPGIYTRVSAYLDWIEKQVWPN